MTGVRRAGAERGGSGAGPAGLLAVPEGAEDHVPPHGEGRRLRRPPGLLPGAASPRPQGQLPWPPQSPWVPDQRAAGQQRRLPSVLRNGQVREASTRLARVQG